MPSPLRILVIDDEKAIRDSFCAHFEDEGHLTFAAHNGRVGLDVFEREHPDLIFVDLRMPEMDGLGVLEHVTRHAPHTPLIVVSGTGHIQDAIEAVRKGAWDYVLKPVEDLSILSHRAHTALEKAQLQRENHAYQIHLQDLVKERTAKLEQALESLRQSEERNRTIVAALPDLLFEFEADGTLRYTHVNNPTLHTMLPEQYVGHNIAEVLPPDLTELTQANITQALMYQQLQVYEYSVSIAGELRYFEARMVPKDEHSVISLVREITKRKQMEFLLLYRLNELETVSKVSSALRAAETLAEMLPILLDQTLAALNTDVGSIRMYDDASQELRPVASRGWSAQLPQIPMRPGEGVTGYVLATRRTYYASNLAEDALTHPLLKPHVPPGWSGIGVPIRTAHEAIGVILVCFPATRTLNESETRLLTTLAEIAGNAIHRTRLHQRTERGLQRLSALRTIDLAISSSFDLKLSLGVLLDQAITQLEAAAVLVLRLDPLTHWLEMLAGRGLPVTHTQNLRQRLSEGYAGRAVLERQLISLPDLGHADPPMLARHLPIETCRAYHAAPLIARGQVKGVLEVFHRDPFQPDHEWVDYLGSLADLAAIAIDNVDLFTNLQTSHLELALAYDATIEGWSRALELRDRETEGHAQRVTELTERLARAMGFSEAELVHIRRGALLHDIGKMGVPDAILLKPGPLTAEERAIMQKHPQYAYEMLKPIAYLRPALDIPYAHHERWDGTGYPNGLCREQIPLAARIFAIVDVYDALAVDRPYRPAWSHEKTVAHIRAQSGKHFDPQVVEEFLKVI